MTHDKNACCKQESTAGQYWNRLAEAAVGKGATGNSRQGFTLVQEELATAREAGDAGGESSAIHGAAVLHLMRGDYWSAMAASLDAFEAAGKAKDRLAEARAVTMLVLSLTPMEPGTEGLDMLERALGIAIEFEDPLLEVRTRNVMGILQGDLERFDEAAHQFETALTAINVGAANFDEWRIVANKANLFRKRAEAAARAGEHERCDEFVALGLDLAVRADAHCEHHGKLPIRLDAINISGMLLGVHGQIPAAVARFETAWRLAVSERHRALLPFLGTCLVPHYLAMNRLAEAENVLLTAYEEARLYRPSAKGESLCQLAASVYARKGDSRRAEQWDLESQRASVEFAAFKRDAQRQQAWVAGRWLA
jgi:tetratricopeptide (TPR) repeat protein